ncbi:MAG TPA: amidohydrolase family protein [Steroidobacteraceae bacterium]|jgi:predicted TIM-barrel fold metal-dependent hydrolase|nr:amidohydrolase family protein [Steroidobacteraceae bacterium]
MNNAIIDVHAHFQPKTLNGFMERFNRATLVPEVPWTDSAEHVEERVRLMDDAGVRMQILSPGTAHYFKDVGNSRTAAQVLNDSFALFTARFPSKFAAYISLPLPHIEASLRELERVASVPGMVGVTVHCSILDRSIAGSEFDPIYEELNRRATILFLHPCRNGICSALINDYQLAESVGTSIEDSLAVIHMIVRRIPQRFPNIRIIVPHLGGMLPMILNRLDNQLPKAHPTLAEPPSVSARRFWYDTVSHGSRAALRCACDALGSERLLPGSDYPFLLLHQPYRNAFTYIETSASSQQDVARILQENAQNLFGRLLVS